MAIIKCPECNKEVSDKSEFCIHCGYPISKHEKLENTHSETISQISNNDEKQNDIQQPINANNYNSNNNPLTDLESGTNLTINTAPNNKKGKIIIISVIAAIVLIAILCSTFFILNNQSKGLNIQNISIGEYKTTSDDTYQAIVSSNETSPFVAVLQNNSDSDDYSFVYMENGEGILLSTKSSDKYNGIGYFEGCAISDSDIVKINTVYEYEDDIASKYLDDDNKKMCTIKFEVELSSDFNGFLFYNASVSTKDDLIRNRVIPISNGQGIGYITLYDLDSSTNNIQAKFIPKFITSSTKLTSNDYKVGTDFKMEKSVYETLGKVGYSGKEQILMNNYKDGIVIYEAIMTEGGKAEEQNITNVYRSYINNNVCNLTTYDLYETSDNVTEPSYTINPVSYLKWNNFNGNSSVANTNNISSLNAEDSKDEINFEYIYNDINASSYYCTVGNDGSYMKIDTNPSDTEDGFSYTAWSLIEDVNEELGLPESLSEKMGKTRAVDGTMSEEYDNVEVSWTYHPDNGLEVIYEKK